MGLLLLPSVAYYSNERTALRSLETKDRLRGSQRSIASCNTLSCIFENHVNLYLVILNGFNLNFLTKDTA